MDGIPRPELCADLDFGTQKLAKLHLNRKSIFLDAINKEILFGMYVLLVFLVVIAGFLAIFCGYGIRKFCLYCVVVFH